MSAAILEHEILIETQNLAGIAGQLTQLFAEAKTDIKTLWGGVVNGQGLFAVIAENNEVVKQILLDSNFSSFHEESVLVIPVNDKVGACANVASTIGNAGININYLYTTIFEKKPAVVVSTEDNTKALGLF